MPVISPEDLHLVALGVVIWVVALSGALSFYLPALRSHDARQGRGTDAARWTALTSDPPHPHGAPPPL